MKKINLKVIASVLVVLLLIPFFSTFINAEATETRASVRDNMAKYGFSADADNLKITTTKELSVYVNAGDANNRTNVAKSYPAGTYYIYKSVDGALNISRTSGEPGAWVNARDLYSSTYKPEPVSNTNSREEFRLSSTTKIYYTASDALNGTNSRGSYSAGTYYVYKRSGNAVNITTTPGTAGAWVNAQDNKPVETKPAQPKPSTGGSNSGSGNNITSDKVKLEKTANVYRNADDAISRRNAVTRYSAGTYYVYKKHGNAVNISTSAGKAGGWINASELTNVQAPAKPSTPTTPGNNADSNTSGQVSLKSRTNIYITASDAERGVNRAGTWAAGNYYVYKTYGKAVNITTVKGQPGAWVLSSTLNGGTSTTPSQPSTPTTPSKPVENIVGDVKIGSRITINSSFKVYMNSYDALNDRNSVGTWSGGTYYVFNTNGKALNVSKNQGSAGGWTVGNVQSVPTTPSNPGNSGSNPSTGKTFNLVLDPGHGGGIAHNRGGVLFNEGDQNYRFTQEILAALQKYKNVNATSTRTNINQDPSFVDRAKAGNGADLYVSIHTNAASAGVRGVEIWGSNDNNSHAFGKEITKTWSQTLNTPDRGVKYSQKPGIPDTTRPVKGNDDTWFIFQNNSAKEKYLLESVFHTNYQDSKVYLDNQKNLANKFMEIVAKHFGLELR